MRTNSQLIKAAEHLRDFVDSLTFPPPVTHIYNPLEYAWEPHRLYLEKFGDSRKRVVLLGMNPGPWGMAQVGVPFGEVAAVRDWMGIEAPVGKPAHEHPKRPVDGFGCARSEVSGRRLWGLMAERFGAPGNFFRNHLVINYCPLVFMENSGRNVTPDKLPAASRAHLNQICDTHLRTTLSILKPEWCIGVGGFAEARAREVFDGVADAPKSGRILHPSPASPAANRGWAEAATRQMQMLGVWK